MNQKTNNVIVNRQDEGLALRTRLTLSWEECPSSLNFSHFTSIPEEPINEMVAHGL